jgi:xanthine dehydrogenase accessory factor
MFDLEGLRAELALHGKVARVVIASLAGSSPRGVGTAMLVWETGQSGTIGGGALEYQAALHAREALIAHGDRLDKVPLGPALGQCCGGSVALLTEVWDLARLASIGDIVARPMPGFGSDMPLKVANCLQRVRNGNAPAQAVQIQGWMIETIAHPSRALWVWGAGHVGRAVVAVLAPLPDIAMTWVDVDAARFPAVIPDGITCLTADNPALLVRHAPVEAEHLILTYSHALDLELCHQLIGHGFGRAGLIGSATKWARFRGRLAALGHSPVQIDRINCPIGDPGLGKHPQAIAIGVAAQLLSLRIPLSKELAL